MPPIAEPTLEGKGYLTAGYGDSGSIPYSFFLREGQNVDVGILKLFLSNKPVNLLHVAQPSPFVPVESNSTAPLPPQFVLIGGRPSPYGLWDTIEFPVVQRRANK